MELIKDFGYQPEIWRGDAQYHEAYSYVKWPCSANFARSTELWDFIDRLRPGMRDDVTALTHWEFQLSVWNLVG